MGGQERAEGRATIGVNIGCGVGRCGPFFLSFFLAMLGLYCFVWAFSSCSEHVSSILAWRIPWTEEPGGLQSIGSQRVEHDRSNLEHTHARIKHLLT